MSDLSTPLNEKLSEARVAALLDQAADHVMILDREGRILYINNIVKPAPATAPEV